MRLSLLAKIGAFTWFLVVLVATFAIFNYPRSWWQDLICQTSPVWALLFVGGLLVQLVRRSRSSLSLYWITLLALQLACVVRTVQIVVPYIYAPQKAYPEIAYSKPIRFLFIDISDRIWSSSPEALRSFIDVEHPGVVVIVRFTDSPVLPGTGEAYPFVLSSTLESGRTVEIFSSLPFQSGAHRDLGYSALPAVHGVFHTPDGASVELGAIDLIPALSQRDFLSSRITSRRLASIFKYSESPRIIFGAFRASSTSQLVHMYVGQLRLRSVYFDSGFGKLRDIFVKSLDFTHNLNVFTAKKIEISRVVESHAEDGGFAAVLFDARIPKSNQN